MPKVTLIFLALLFTLSGCSKHLEKELSTIQLIDHNGISETFSSKKRLELFKNFDFTNDQPYAQVVRVYRNFKSAGTFSVITSYYPTGQIQKYLEAKGSQACGFYKEWHPNGELKVKAKLVGGIPQLTEAAEKSWLFDGDALAWSETGSLKAIIHYQKGSLEGVSKSFHSNGLLWKEVPYKDNLQEGSAYIFTSSGSLLLKQRYKKGALEGKSERYWPSGIKSAIELYSKNLLTEAHYFSPQSKLIARVIDGEGKQAIFRKKSIYMLREIKRGIPEGKVAVFNQENKLVKTYFLHSGIKHGPEIHYYTDLKSQSPKILLHWSEGKLSGSSKTWYPNGTLESIKELAVDHTIKSLNSWYTDGSIMLMEKYEGKELVEAEYFSRGSQTPCSKIHAGSGIATFFDADGTFLREVIYQGGEPVVE